jgi:hypothetical protein
MFEAAVSRYEHAAHHSGERGERMDRVSEHRDWRFRLDRQHGLVNRL